MEMEINHPESSVNHQGENKYNLLNQLTLLSLYMEVKFKVKWVFTV